MTAEQTDRLEVKVPGGQCADTSYRYLDRPKKSVLKGQKAIEYLFLYIILTIQ